MIALKKTFSQSLCSSSMAYSLTRLSSEQNELTILHQKLQSKQKGTKK